MKPYANELQEVYAAIEENRSWLHVLILIHENAIPFVERAAIFRYWQEHQKKQRMARVA